MAIEGRTKLGHSEQRLLEVLYAHGGFLTFARASELAGEPYIRPGGHALHNLCKKGWARRRQHGASAAFEYTITDKGKFVLEYMEQNKSLSGINRALGYHPPSDKPVVIVDRPAAKPAPAPATAADTIADRLTDALMDKLMAKVEARLIAKLGL